jgi:transposase
MNQPNFILGIDISKDFFDCTLIDQSEKLIFQQKFSMDYTGFDTLNQLLKQYPQDQLLICLESTGIYHLNLLCFLLEQQYQVVLVNPLLVNAFLKSITLRKSSNDVKSAYGISLFAKRNWTTLNLAKKEELTSLKSLIRERESYAKEIAKVKTEIKGCLNQLFPELPRKINVFTKSILNLLLQAPSAKIIKMKRTKTINKFLSGNKGNKLSTTAEQIKSLAEKSVGITNPNLEKVLISKIKKLLFFQSELDSLDTLIDENIKQFPSIKADINTIKSIKGIGDITAKNFVVEIIDINNFESHKQLTAYIGTDPAIKQSGSSIHVQGKITKRGNSYLRRTIYQMALGVSRCNPIFKDYLLKKRTEGKKYKQAMIAVANKLIRTIFTMLKNKTEFNPNYNTL